MTVTEDARIGPGPRLRTRRLLALLADLASVLAFASAGKSSHEAGDPSWVVLAIAWPYALAAVVAHAGLLWRGRLPARVWPEGVVVLAVTYLLGMSLRVASGRGMAVGFLVVAAIFLTITLLGWRGVVRLVLSRRARSREAR